MQKKMDDLYNLLHSTPESRSGRVGYAILWLLGVPIPVLLLIYMLRGCT